MKEIFSLIAEWLITMPEGKVASMLILTVIGGVAVTYVEFLKPFYVLFLVFVLWLSTLMRFEDKS